jgi:hypothetical protein
MTSKIVLTAALALAIPAVASAQHKCQCCGGAQTSAATPQTPAPAVDHQSHAAEPIVRAIPRDYEVENETMLVGIVESVMRHEGMDVQITLGIGENRAEVVVAPKDWLDEQQYVFRPGERIEVVAALSSADLAGTFVAREIRTATATMILRDSEGRALWTY